MSDVIINAKYKQMDTFPKLLTGNYLKWGSSKPALRKKRYGIWNTYTWKEYYENVKYFSLGLVSLGFKRQDKIAIIGDNDPEWWFAEIGAQAVGGIAVGIFVDCMAKEIQYFIENSESTFVVAKDQEQVDKILQIRNDIPAVQKVIYWETKGMYSYTDPFLLDFNSVIDKGKKYEASHPDIFQTNINAGNADDIACFSYTSGTTGLPKAAMLSYRMIYNGIIYNWHDYPWYEDDDYFSFVSPAWAIDQSLGFCAALMSGAVVHFPEKPETIIEDGREIAAACQFAGAKMWEEMYRNIRVKLADADWIKRSVYKLFMPVGYKKADALYNEKKLSTFWLALYKIADWLNFRPLRDLVGYPKSRYCMVAGAMLSPELFRYFRAIGIPLFTYYGLTESGSITQQASDKMRLGSSGKIFLNRELRLTNDGEILTRAGEFTFSGYYNNPQATAEKLKGGWFYTGDAGYLDGEGFFFFLDRLSDMAKLKDGVSYAPGYIESNLRFSPYIKEAMTVGEAKDYVIALIGIDAANVAKWAEKNRILFTTLADLSQKPGVMKLIMKEIEQVNLKLPLRSRIKKFINLHKEFDPDEAELTRTRKLKRNVMEAKYQEIIDACYQNKSSIEIQSEIKYRSGKTRISKVLLTIQDTEK